MYSYEHIFIYVSIHMCIPAARCGCVLRSWAGRWANARTGRPYVSIYILIYLFMHIHNIYVCINVYMYVSRIKPALIGRATESLAHGPPEYIGLHICILIYICMFRNIYTDIQICTYL